MEWLYQCQKCGAIIRTSEHQKIPIVPEFCDENQGGCGRKSKFVDKTNEYLHMELKKLKKK